MSIFTAASPHPSSFRLPFGGRSFHFLTPDAPDAAPAGESPVEPAKLAKPGKPKPEAAVEPAKQALSDAELEQIREDARKAVREELAAEQARKDEEAAQALLVEQGKWKDIAEAEQKKRELAEAKALQLQADNRRIEVREQVRSYLSEKHKDYVGSEKYILPLVSFDAETAAEDVTKRIKAAADQFVNDNPRQRQASPPPPPGGQHASSRQSSSQASPSVVGGRFAVNGAASRF